MTPASNSSRVKGPEVADRAPVEKLKEGEGGKEIKAVERDGEILENVENLENGENVEIGGKTKKKKPKKKKLAKQSKEQFDKWVADVLSKYPMDSYPKVAHDFNGYNFRGNLRPYFVTPKLVVPSSINRPDYADDPKGWPESEYSSPDNKSNSFIHVHTPEEIALMTEVCKIGREVLDIIGRAVAVGVTTDMLDKIGHEAIISRGCYPSPLNYHTFPKSICTSVNEIICHGIPDTRELKSGDIVNVDVSVYKNGWHSDLNEMFLVGEVDDAGIKLVQTSYECLAKACEMIGPGVMYRDVGKVIAQHASSNNMSVVKTYCGHGVGRLFHCAPTIPHYAKNKAVGLMKPGHIFTIEPMINEGNSWGDTTWPDNWTSSTLNGMRSAQFEHTFLVTDCGVEILTARKSASRTRMVFDITDFQR